MPCEGDETWGGHGHHLLFLFGFSNELGGAVPYDTIAKSQYPKYVKKENPFS